MPLRYLNHFYNFQFPYINVFNVNWQKGQRFYLEAINPSLLTFCLFLPNFIDYSSQFCVPLIKELPLVVHWAKNCFWMGPAPPISLPDFSKFHVEGKGRGGHPCELRFFLEGMDACQSQTTKIDFVLFPLPPTAFLPSLHPCPLF
jgi:hypothetical protein